MHSKKTERPLFPGEATATAVPGPSSHPPGSSPFADRRILVAEDNPVNSQVAVRLLQNLGCQVDTASNGHEAILKHEQQRYDLILMDCHMPQLDGYEATRQIRAMPHAFQHIPIIALTAAATPAEEEKCLAAGMNDFLSKPLRPQLLQNALHRCLPRTAPPLETIADDQDELKTVLDLFGEDFTELAALYQSESPKKLGLMHTAGTTNDSVQMARMAHVFGGSCASIGATFLATLCKNLEIHAKAGELQDWETKLEEINKEYGRVIEKLQSLVMQIKKPS